MAKDNGKVLIHGKEYETVASRVKKFREQYSDTYSITTEIVSADDKTVVIKAIISKLWFAETSKNTPEQAVIATGYAEENRQSSSINKTSALENCETSAIGRALAAFGLAGTEYASADEVAAAVSKQQSSTQHSTITPPKEAAIATDKQRKLIADKLFPLGFTTPENIKNYLATEYGINGLLSKTDATMVIEDLLANED